MNIFKIDESEHEGAETLPSAERRFLLSFGLKVTGVLLGGCMLSLTSVSRARSEVLGVGVVASFPYKPHYAMLVRQNLCTGCNKCVEACASTNNVPAYGYRISVLHRQVKIDSLNSKTEFMPVFCSQCNRPPCVRVCPTKATYKDQKNGIVMINDRLCIGCKACITACPYNVRYFNEKNRAIDKCDFCFRAQLSQNRSNPVCVEACPFDALVFGDLTDKENELSKIVHTPGRTILVLRPEKGTLPNVFYLRD